MSPAALTMRSDFSKLGRHEPHELLGVARGADRQRVIRAFRQKARHGGHPDTGGDEQTFNKLSLARDILLDPHRLAAYDADRRAVHGAGQARHLPEPAAPEPDLGSAKPTAPVSKQHQDAGESSHPDASLDRPASQPMNGLAVVSVGLALLGPLMWPAAIVSGHLALRRIKRTGQGGDALVPVLLLVLYFLTIPALLLALVALLDSSTQ